MNRASKIISGAAPFKRPGRPRKMSEIEKVAREHLKEAGWQHVLSAPLGERQAYASAKRDSIFVAADARDETDALARLWAVVQQIGRT